MSGAIALAGMAAVRTGAGLVRLAVPDCCVETIAAFSPLAMLIPVERVDGKGRIAGMTAQLEQWILASDCVAVGPGMGQSAQLHHFVLDLFSVIRAAEREIPVVFDADGLNALACHSDWTSLVNRNTVLTPHPGEWSRLSSVPANENPKQRATAIEFARRVSCTILLKGQHTQITNGVQTVNNSTGTPAMATGGSGDVLTGVITALICQGLAAFDAAHLAAHLHGLAGQLAQAELRSHVVLPTELIQFLPKAFNQIGLS
jgi:ADP-dependent NAD(P)H-hydrate dehydratase